MRRLLYVAAGIALAVVLSQLLVPPYLEHRAEKRLTERGGSAEVEIDALPAVRLLFNDGKRIQVRGEGIHVELLKRRGRVFDELDRFDEADVRLTRVSAGPFAVRRVTIARDRAGEPYALAISATVTARALSSYAGDQVAGPLGGLVARIATGTLPLTAEPIPIEVDADIESRDGRPEIRNVDGSVLGLPAGPLAETIASAIAARL